MAYFLYYSNKFLDIYTINITADNKEETGDISKYCMLIPFLCLVSLPYHTCNFPFPFIFFSVSQYLFHPLLFFVLILSSIESGFTHGNTVIRSCLCVNSSPSLPRPSMPSLALSCPLPFLSPFQPLCRLAYFHNLVLTTLSPLTWFSVLLYSIILSLSSCFYLYLRRYNFFFLSSWFSPCLFISPSIPDIPSSIFSFP